MKNTTRVIAVTACYLVLPHVLAAQLCSGGPALAPTNVGNVGVGASFFEGGKGYHVSAVVGGPFFAGGGFSYSDFDDTDLSFKLVSGSVGYEISPASSVWFCPTAAVGYGFGLEIFGVDFTSLAFVPGLAFGVETEVSPTITVIPYGEGWVEFQRVTFDAGPLGEESESETVGTVILGLTIMFNDVLGIGPSVGIPVATEDGDTAFVVSARVAIGGSR